MPEDDELEKAMEEDEKRSKTFPTSIEIKNEPEVASSPQAPYILFDRQDESQILLELEGNLTDPIMSEMAYSFPSGGKRVTGISWMGVKALMLEYGNIEIVDIHIAETPDGYRVTAKAHDIQKNVSIFGVAEQAKRMKMRDGSETDDCFALAKCASKAMRNAIQSILPRKLVVDFIERCLKAKGESSGPKVRYG